MDALLGFAVLTSPLFLIVLWVPVCIALAVWVSWKVIKKGIVVRIVGGLLIFLLVLILPVTDEIAGRIYFNHLCETEAGVKVYQTIELPTEYWDKDGKPKFYDERTGNFSLILSQYADISSKRTVRLFGIEENNSILLDKTTHKKISESPLFRLWGGWIKRNLTPHNTAMHCGGDWNEFVSKQFKSIATSVE